MRSTSFGVLGVGAAMLVVLLTACPDESGPSPADVVSDLVADTVADTVDDADAGSDIVADADAVVDSVEDADAVVDGVEDADAAIDGVEDADAVVDGVDDADAVIDGVEDADGGDSEDADASGCMVWEITYDLTGSVFEISDTPFGAGDQLNTLAEPYDADDHVGPGSIVLRFEDVGGAPGGKVAITSYEVALGFVVDSATKVTTDLQQGAGPSDCGVASGVLTGTVVTWTPPEMSGHHSLGTILCEGTLCGVAGLPDGDPVPIDETGTQSLDDFQFSADLSTFTMDSVVVQQDQNSTSTWTYSGTEVSRASVAAPECLCP